MVLGKLRSVTMPFTRAISSPIAATGISPNLFSFLAIPLALSSAWFISRQAYGHGFILALLAVSIDLFDGSVAELQGKKSLFGNYFETMVDKAVEIILFIGASTLYPLAAICALGFSLLASYAKPRAALVIIMDNRDWPAVGEHAERMLLLLAGILLSFFSISISGFGALEVALWLITAMTVVGGAQRILYARELISRAEKEGRVLPYLKG